MEFTEKFLRDEFRKAYASGLEEKERGNDRTAARYFRNAAALQNQLAKTVENGEAERQRAEKLLRIAEALDARQKAAGPAFVPSDSAPDFADASDPDSVGHLFRFYRAEDLKDGFDSVIGLEEAKEAIRKYVINPIRYPDAYDYKFINNKGILLMGPPGTGKTTFAKAVSHEINQPFALVDASALVNCYIGETAKNIDRIFAYLRSYSAEHDCGMTVFFDEFDEIAKKRGGDDKVSEAAVPALIRNLDGVIANRNFLILANTNLDKEAFDPAVYDRFRQRIYVGLPDRTARRKLFEYQLGDVEPEYLKLLDLDRAAEVTDGLSGRDITYLCDDLKYRLSEVKAGLFPKEKLGEEFFKMIRNRSLN